MLSSLVNENAGNNTTTITERIAMMSCKAAVKGGRSINIYEAHKLVSDLFTLDNPFNCPHGRPIIIDMTKREIEKKFKRIL